MSFIRFFFAVGVCLTAVSSQAASIVLHWTAPGDDGTFGRASQYDLRYSSVPITNANWSTATRVGGLPTPLPYGNREIFTVRLLAPSTTYYFGIKAADELGNWSPLSNIVARTTCAGCVGHTGNVDGSADGRVDLVDLTRLVAYLTANSGVQICFEAANCDASRDGTINLTDLAYLTAFLTQGATLPSCP